MSGGGGPSKAPRGQVGGCDTQNQNRRVSAPEVHTEAAYRHRRTLCTGNISTLPAEPLKRAYAMFLPALKSVGVTAAPRAGHVKVAALPLWPKSVRHPLLQLLGGAARCVRLFLLLSLHPCVLWDMLPAQRGMAQHRSWGPRIPCNQSQPAPRSPQTALPGVWRWLQSIPALTSRLRSPATSRRSSPPLPLKVSLSPKLSAGTAAAVIAAWPGWAATGGTTAAQGEAGSQRATRPWRQEKKYHILWFLFLGLVPNAMLPHEQEDKWWNKTVLKSIFMIFLLLNFFFSKRVLNVCVICHK